MKCACVILSAVTLTMFLTGIKANTTESAPTKQSSEESVSKLPEWDESGILEEKQKEYRQQALQDELTQRQQEAQKWLADRHIEVPENIKAICKAKEEQYDISATFLEALIYEESRFHVDAANGPCRGLCQVNIRFLSAQLERPGGKHRCRLSGDYVNHRTKWGGRHGRNNVVLSWRGAWRLQPLHAGHRRTFRQAHGIGGRLLMNHCWNCGTEIEPGCMKYAPDEYGRPFSPVCPDCYREGA